MPREEIIPTRASLLKRIADWRDQASWQDFFDVYRKLIYGVARRAGLSDAEANDVVQETMVSVARHIQGFAYDPGVGSFKSWLLNMTRWRIVDQMRKRGPPPGNAQHAPETQCDSPQLAPDESIDDYWKSEWERTLLQAAMARVKQKIDPAKYQIFDLYVTKDLAAQKVAERMGISVSDVYLAKHRVTHLIKEEVERLQKAGA